jgi:hypothetical protein
MTTTSSFMSIIRAVLMGAAVADSLRRIVSLMADSLRLAVWEFSVSGNA